MSDQDNKDAAVTDTDVNTAADVNTEKPKSRINKRYAAIFGCVVLIILMFVWMSMDGTDMINAPALSPYEPPRWHTASQIIGIVGGIFGFIAAAVA